MKEMLRRLAKNEQGRAIANAGWLYFDQIGRAVMGLVVFGLVARTLGPRDYGVLSYALAFPGVFLPLAVFGLDYVVVRDFVRHPEDRDAIFGTAFAIKGLAAVTALAVALAVAVVTPEGGAARGLLALTSLSLVFQPILTMDFYFQSRVAAKFPALARLGACLLASIFRVCLAWRGAPLSWFAGAFVIEAALYAVALVVAWRVSGTGWVHPWRCWSSSVARRLLAAAWPLVLADLAIVCYLKLDQLLLSHFAGPEELGRYAAAFRLSDAAQFFSLALINSFFPRIVRLHQQSRESFQENVNRFFRRMTWWSLVVALAITAAAPAIAHGVLGARFDRAAPVLAVLAWANVFITQIAVRGKWFLLEEMQIYTLACFVIGAAVHLALLPQVAPQWGALGTAVSFGVAQLIMAVIAPALFSRSRPASVLALRSLWPMKN